MKEITFESLPSAVSILLEKMEKIENSLAGFNGTATEPDRWMNVEELMAYHPDRQRRQSMIG